MEHDLFIDGNVKEYTWTIKTGKKLAEQIRKHPPAYLSGGKLDVKDIEESKFIALLPLLDIAYAILTPVMFYATDKKSKNKW